MRTGRGAGNNGPVSTAKASSFLNTAGKVGRVTISERIEAGRRERRVLARVSRAAWRLEQAERERVWALVSARAEGISIRTLAAAAGLSPSRVHQIVAAADLGPGLPKPRSGARWSITASHRLAIPGSREYECLSLVPQSSAVTSTNATLCTSPQLQEN